MTQELQWARDCAVQTIKKLPFARSWAFEYTPASSDSATATYLQKVREADFVVWLVGSQTTQPVVNEINESIATHRRLLVFKLPAKQRDSLTHKLLTTVSEYCKWQAISAPSLLPSALTASLSDEFVRAVRDPSPVNQQTLQQWRTLSIAKCKQAWITLGVHPTTAAELAEDSPVGDVLTPENVRLQMVVADGGSGKSLAVSRVFQRAIERALQDGTQPFPLFVDARNLHEPLDEYIERRTAGLVQPLHRSTLIIVDGLDERGVSQANDWITQVRYCVDAYPKSRFLVTSRLLPGLRLPEQQTSVPPLDHRATAELIARVSGRPFQSIDMYNWADSVQADARRPFFAVIIGVELRERPDTRFDKPVDLLNRLAQHVIESSGQRETRVNELLQKLGVMAISTGRRVPKADVSFSRTDHQLLADSRLVDAKGSTLDFNHEVLREWYASRGIIEQNCSIDDIFPVSDRWITALKLVLDSDNEKVKSMLRHKLASTDPGLAGLLQQRTLDDRPDGAIVDPALGDPTFESAEQVGQHLSNAMDSWRLGLGELFRVIGPAKADGSVASVGVYKDSIRITTSWYRGTRILPRVVCIQDNAAPWHGDRGWAVLTTETTPLAADWPWLATKHHLVESLSRAIMTRRLALPSKAAVRELVWAFALAIEGRSELDPRPIRVQRVLHITRQISQYAAQATIAFEVGRLQIAVEDLNLVAHSLERMLEQGQEVIVDPWPSCDRRPPAAGPSSTWDFYSRDRLLERVAAVYSAALDIYTEMIARWFRGFRNRLQFSLLFPLRLEGRLETSNARHWEGAPTLTWRATALPENDTSLVALEWGPADDIDLLSYWKDEKTNLESIRHGTGATPCPIVGDSLPSIDSIRPATDLAHSWLIMDLRELNWTDLSRVSLL